MLFANLKVRSIGLFIDIDDIRIHYESFGEGEPILLLHGWGGQIESWGPVIPALAQGRKVCALDFPGLDVYKRQVIEWDERSQL